MSLSPEVIQGILLPFAGTTLGAACVFLIRGTLHHQVQRVFTGFAAGVMVAASVWSLLIPALDQAVASGQPAFVPAVLGFWVGILFLLFLDHVIPHLHLHGTQTEGPAVSLSRTIKLVLAVILHNIPEGMAVGVVYAGLATGHTTISGAAALSLSLGIAIQNFPEGAIISLPLRADGVGRFKSFVYGVLSGVVEPVSAVAMIAAIQYLLPFLPYFLSFAAGAMLYVVVEELIPEMSEGEHSNIGTLAFATGFTLMMALDVMLG